MLIKWNQLIEMLRREDISSKQCSFVQSNTSFLPFPLCRSQWSVWLWACWVCFEEQHHPSMETSLYSGRANPGDWLHHAHAWASSKVNMGLFFYPAACDFWSQVLFTVLCKIMHRNLESGSPSFTPYSGTSAQISVRSCCSINQGKQRHSHLRVRSLLAVPLGKKLSLFLFLKD